MDASALDYPFAPPGPGEAAAVAEGVLWMRVPVPMRPDHVNVYALEEAEGWTVVDTGLDTPACREVWAALLAGPLGGRPVLRVVVTHHHPDHVGLAGWLQARGAELLATRTAWLLARMLRLDVQARPLPEALEFLRRAGMDAAMLEARAAARPFNYADVVAQMPLGFRRIVQGEELVLGGRRWRVEIGHGHAPEQATLWGLGHDLVIAGDQILPGITPNLGVHATEPEADPVGEWMASCLRLEGLAREGLLGLPGHGRPFRGVGARLGALLADARGAQERLWAALGEPRTTAACFEPLYGRRITAGEYGLALAEAAGHLNRLRAAGRASREMGPQGAWLWRRV